MSIYSDAIQNFKYFFNVIFDGGIKLVTVELESENLEKAYQKIESSHFFGREIKEIEFTEKMAIKHS